MVNKTAGVSMNQDGGDLGCVLTVEVTGFLAP